MKVKYLKLFLIFLIAAGIISAQETKQKNRDTSFTINSAAQKMKKDYPDAVPVILKIPADVSVIKNLVYSSPAGRKLHLDLFIPAKKGNKPLTAVIIVHGGGWRSGERTMDYHMAADIAANGFAAVSIEYQLSTEALYPAAVQNINSAVIWLKNNAHKYKVNQEKIILMGSSAGGHLAALAGVTEGNNKFRDSKLKGSTKVAGIIDMDGVLDMTTPEESGKDTIPSKPSAAKQWLGFTFKDKPEIWREASPINYITASTPPILFINSSLPRFHSGRDSVIAMMNKYKIYSEVHTIPGTPHPFWLFHPWYDEALKYIISFLKRF